MSFIFLYVTTGTQAEAQKIALQAIKKKLAACANIFPIFSYYEWKGEMKEEGEWALILKTVKEKSIALQKEIEKIHSYKVPCIIEIPIKPNSTYGAWIAAQCSRSVSSADRY